ncbi:MAG: leucine-rich repeat protein [Clostridia bacterium]|nr:leucine-rich repeat protein [Clostridia bacterium]
MKKIKFLLLLVLMSMTMASNAKADMATLPDGVKTIEDYAFYQCANLFGEFVIPDSVTMIGAHAFDGCSGLTMIILPDDDIIVDDTAFLNTSAEIVHSSEYLQSNYEYTISDEEVTIERYIGKSQNNLIIPSYIEGYPVKAIADNAFGSVVLNGKLTLPSQLREIGDHAFYNQSGLTDILELPASLKMIGDYAFRYTGFSGDLILPDSVEKIGDKAFEYCINMEGISMSANIMELGDMVFRGCPMMKGEFVMPTSLKKCGNDLFWGTDVTVVWEHGALDYDVIDQEVKITSYHGIADAATIIPSHIEGYPVTVIGANAFYGLANENRTISGTLVLPETIRTVESMAFAYCDQLTGDLLLPDAIETIERYAFAYCSNLDGMLVLPSQLKILGEAAFDRSDKLKCDGLVIPSGVKAIGDSAFYRCVNLTGELILPEGLKSVGAYAFYFTNLNGELKLPSTLEYIYHDAFAFSSFDGTVKLPEDIRYLGSSAFQATMISGDVVVPESVEYVGMDVFDTWFGMNATYLCELKAGFEYSVYNGDNPIVWLDGYNNIPVENIQLPTEYQGNPIYGIKAFAMLECDQITGKLCIPEGYVEIQDCSFQGCTGLWGVPELPSTLKYIGNSAFANCTGLSGTLEVAGDVRIDVEPFVGTNLTVIQNGEIIYAPENAE